MIAILEVPCSIFRVTQYIWSREELGIFWWKIKRTRKRLLASASVLPYSRRGDRAPQKRARFPSLWLLGWPRASHWEKSMAQSHTPCSTKDTSWANDMPPALGWGCEQWALKGNVKYIWRETHAIMGFQIAFRPLSLFVKVLWSSAKCLAMSQTRPQSLIDWAITYQPSTICEVIVWVWNKVSRVYFLYVSNLVKDVCYTILEILNF